MNLLVSFATKISYKYRHTQKLIKFQEKVKKYNEMSDDEFLMEYSDVSAHLDEKKLVLSIISVTLIVSIIMDIGKYFYNGFIQLFRINMVDPVDEKVLMAISYVGFVIIILICVVIFIVIFDLLKTITRLNQEKIVLDEIKKSRRYKDE